MKSRKYQQYSDNPDALKTLKTEQLQALWSAIFKQLRRPQSNDIIMHKIAYYLQVRAYGGLSVRSTNQLNRLIHGVIKKSVNKYTFENNHQLIREWNGKKYVVAVQGKDRFLYDGKVYKTLTAIAREITGAHWSGPLFFGLRKYKNGQRR